ncbi:alkyl sulfatase dimerization domain-containing protein [Polynucleobacter necessarius]|uniref:alkyl sulfatase dimerization domain-containing protein n=1 Tax=Polynucleobacter necessarius TaxID=576610 RepID=UPI001E581AFB|nr:alkyl sulfatase dimerization domain-containing protein [Polynucleobacter necessarius]
MHIYTTKFCIWLTMNGVTINEIQNVYKQPDSLKKQWAAHSYHGLEEHNSRAVINRYLGYWDANPATLAPLSPRDSAPLYVEMMGGSGKILAKGRELYRQGKYREAMEIVNKLVYAQPDNTAAKDLLADIFEQIGYQKESPSMRNSFLGAAYELRHGMPTGASPKSNGPDMIKAMNTELWLNSLGISLDSKKAAGMNFTINLSTPDNGEKFIVEMSNSALTNIKGQQAKNPTLSITRHRSDLERVMGGQTTFEQLQAEGKAKFDGDRKAFDQLKSALTVFKPDFELMPGTKSKQIPKPVNTKPQDPFTAQELAITAGE